MIDLCKIFSEHSRDEKTAPYSLEAALVCSGKFLMFDHTEMPLSFGTVYKVDSEWAYAKDIYRYLSDKVIVAYASEKFSAVFVKKDNLEEFKRVTSGQGLLYITVESLDEILFVSDADELPEEFGGIVWLDDEFMDNNEVPFNFEAYEKIIEPKIPYLNPKGFTLLELIHYTSEIM